MRVSRRLVFLAAGALIIKASPATAQMAMPTLGLLERVLMVESGAVSGTIFSFDMDNREYWLTAKHILTGATKPPYGSVTEKSATLSILNPVVQERLWIPVIFSVLDILTGIDIVVLAASKPLMARAGSVTPRGAVTPIPDSTILFLGSDCEFLGYPAVVNGAWQATLPGGIPHWMPFTKHCTISALTTEGTHLIFLDGINNEGFSGGPVIWNTGDKQEIICVISGYYEDRADVVVLVQAQGSSDITPTPTVPKTVAKVNSGLFIATSIQLALDAIRRNPIGPLRQTQ
jgi:hypothetical protein